MICKNVTLLALVERTYYPLKWIKSNQNTCIYEEKDGQAILTIVLCNILPGEKKRVKRALAASGSALQLCFSEMWLPRIDRYVVEDSQVILHIWQEGKYEVLSDE